MPHTILDTPAAWVAGDGPESEIVLYTQCILKRNFADFPYTHQCSHPEKKTIEDRIIGLIQSLSLLPGGQYLSFEEIDPCEAHILVERGVVPESILKQDGPRGVYISADQSLNICINAGDHLTMTGIAPGLHLHDIWSRMNALDDNLARLLDYAFNDRLGYLTHELSSTGAGLSASAVLHLPTIVINQSIPALSEDAQRTRHDLHPEYAIRDAASCDLYRIVNTSTLGQSEDEILFNLKNQIVDILQREKNARADMMESAQIQIEDRVSRALGLATHARILAFEEAITVWSSLRLGVANGLLDYISMSQLNELYLSSQQAHLEAKLGTDCDDMTLSVERARMFRDCFTH